jgi:hypothetical protein
MIDRDGRLIMCELFLCMCGCVCALLQQGAYDRPHHSAHPSTDEYGP